ncbi:ABC transporter substrate-binding protein [Chromobacterium vaccinii]|uniref:ABC transporter substrate-binding protein n=1 Tax=Chromobacterium vaccinii TaxID=1108595 RepID=A0A1D9LGZ0_9NEIS|nr:ABC transporter substrate-binding protein [Chromobacterium vaccinii]AOZ50509.1 ABC transporter substrate-binding protein [Chromobacterium vaccinii]MCD4487013.1 ABC transporter substrate-binding protein [Chromobacterium vaccinii]MCD4500249.1 ABC transporter substrate-binding protein [Chromobacterium vaccinii]QND83144.1 Histidine ABC transporter substrate-binding protein HisJ [Chromobacterium vaccinii]QND88375.1 Histidine ABC transporter substrate-binding protein HisJ [Chromobacterium vaccini
MKKALAALAVGLMAASLGAYAKDWKEIRFGVDASYAPFEYKAPSGQVVGFDVDLGNEICKRMKAKCVWVENDFDGMIPALKAKKFDGVLSSMSMTEARMKEIAFSAKLFNTPTRMVAKSGSGLMPTPASLKGKRVGVEQGTIQEAYAKKHWAPAGVEVVPYQNQTLVLADLTAGRLDASLQDAVQADIGFLKKPEGKGFAFAGKDLVDPQTLGEGAGIGLRKEDKDLKAGIDKAIADMLKDGTYKKIEKKYFSFDVYGG